MGHTPRKAELYANLYSIELIPIFFSFFEFIFLSAVGVLGICHITGIWMPRKKMITDLLLFFLSLKKKQQNISIHSFMVLKKRKQNETFSSFFSFFSYFNILF